MEAFISSLRALSLMIGMAVILGIVALYMFLALVSSELGLEEKKKENPDETRTRTTSANLSCVRKRRCATDCFMFTTSTRR